MTSEELIIELEALGFKEFSKGSDTDTLLYVHHQATESYDEQVRFLYKKNTVNSWRFAFDSCFYRASDDNVVGWFLIEDGLSLESMLLLYKDMQ